MSTPEYLPRRSGHPQGAPLAMPPAWPPSEDADHTERMVSPSKPPMAAPAEPSSAYTPPPPVQPPAGYTPPPVAPPQVPHTAPPQPVTVYAFPPQGQYPGESYTTHDPAPPVEEPAPTNIVAPEPVRARPAGPPPRRDRVTFWRVCKSEWIKLFTLNSTWWVLFVTIAVALGLGVLLMVSMRMMVADGLGGVTMPPQELRATDAASQSAQLLQLILGVLAVLFITNEYSSGQIRSSLTAVPKRWTVLAAKTAIISVVSFIVSGVSYYGAILVGWPMIAGYQTKELPEGWSLVDDRFTAGSLKMIALMSLATVLTLIFALAVGALLRNTAAGISTLVVVLFLLPVFMTILGWDWAATAQGYLLSSCQVGIYTDGPLDFVTSLWVTATWAFAPLLVAGVLLKVRDA